MTYPQTFNFWNMTYIMVLKVTKFGEPYLKYLVKTQTGGGQIGLKRVTTSRVNVFKAWLNVNKKDWFDQLPPLN